MGTDVRKRTTGLIVLAAAAILAGLAGCRPDSEPLAGASASAAPVASAVDSPSAGPASAPASGPTTGPAPSQPGPPPTSAGGSGGSGSKGSCVPANLTVDPVQSDGAMGHQGYGVTVTNHGSTCHIPAYPSLTYTDASGTSHPLPTTKQAPAHTLTVLQHNGKAQFMLLAVNAYGGYDPSSAACAHPATYAKLAIQFDAGRLAITGLTLNVRCGDITLIGWSQPNPG